MCSGFKYVTTSYCISCFQNIITLKHFVPIRVISYEAELYKLLLFVTACLLISYDRLITTGVTSSFVYECTHLVVLS